MKSGISFYPPHYVLPHMFVFPAPSPLVSLGPAAGGPRARLSLVPGGPDRGISGRLEGEVNCRGNLPVGEAQISV